jgi:peptidoglycan/LPS O-acetylase OafA/YrhL
MIGIKIRREGGVLLTSPVTRRFGHDYRPDIDGLRAIAIVPVILFHYGFSLFPGGYVGVDVFFVISGYLITKVILDDIAAGKFSVAQFYERRIRRILPALCVVVLAAILAAWWLLTTKDMARFGAEVWYSSIFSTNFLFFRKDGYFDGASNMRLLLHTWSLSVEEQFYIFMPLLLLWGTHRFRARLSAVLGILMTASLLFSAYAVYHFPSSDFYLLPSRAWELLCGSLLAIGAAPAITRRWGRELLAVTGLVLIAIAVFRFSNATFFPGMAATLPCLGTAALIWSAHSTRPTVVQTVLSLRPLVWIGRISYSLYLWHWLLLVLGIYYLVRLPTLAETDGLIGATVLLSIATYYLIEQPFRKKQVLAGRRQLFAAAAITLLAMGVFGKTAELSDGFPGRLNDVARRYADMSGTRDPRNDACMTLPVDGIRAGQVCAFGTPAAGAPDFAVWGDSHSGALMPAFDSLSAEYGVWGLLFGAGSCPPLLGVTVSRADEPNLACPEVADAAISAIKSRSIRTVFLVGRWALYSEGWPKIGVDARNKPIFLADSGGLSNIRENRAIFARGLDRTLDQLQAAGITVYVVESVPEALVDVPNALAINTKLNRPNAVLSPETQFTEDRQAWVNNLFADAQACHRLTILSMTARLCGNERCMIEQDGVPLYWDNNHLSVAGALYVKPVFDDAFKQLRDHRQSAAKGPN